MTNLQEFKQIVRKLDVASAVQLDSPDRKQVSLLRKQDEADLLDTLEITCTYFASLMSQNNAALDFVIPEIANELIQNYWFLTYEEICLVLRNGVIGKYKNPQQFTHQTFDLETVLGWFQHYNDHERCLFVTAHTNKKQLIEASELPAQALYEHAQHNAKLLNDIEKQSKKAKLKRVLVNMQAVEPDAQSISDFEQKKKEQLRKFEEEFLKSK
jgi:hypothetical protein